MIHSKDRSGWIGASDTKYVMGSWSGKSFEKWWLVKLGLRREFFASDAMQAGSAYEHRILDALGIPFRDRQIRIRRYRLRVNLDGETFRTVHEVKTYSAECFSVTRPYWMQCQVESFAAGKPVVIDAYRITPEELQNFYLPIDKSRLSEHPIHYDADWINQRYLPRIKHLSKCLKKGVWPDECAV